MNSMFSSFDALCAEVLGQTVKANFSPMTKAVVNKVADNASKKQEGNSSAPAAFVRKQQKRTPRFAPELDGLNCFETLVSY